MEIFVFGSNLAGRHGAGAAFAAKERGAIYGRGEGLQGSVLCSFQRRTGLPGRIEPKTLPL